MPQPQKRLVWSPVNRTMGIFLLVAGAFLGAGADGNESVLFADDEGDGSEVTTTSPLNMKTTMYSSKSVSDCYAGSCPNAEQLIRKSVKRHYKSDKTVLAGILRMHFHDCFVEGCDASLLLDSTPTDGTDVEKRAEPNLSVHGFEVIDDAKESVEAACPGIVSCADILAMAARDSTVLLGGKYYKVPTGRYDGRNSRNSRVNIPLPTAEFKELVKSFMGRGLTSKDLVVLSGGHSIGVARCLNFQSRLYNFSGVEGKSDPSLNPEYLEQLKRLCPRNADPSPSVELDKGSQFRFDNSYFKNLVAGRVLFTSDQTLVESHEVSYLVKHLAESPDLFYEEFAQSMINMGNIGWKTKTSGEIRRHCRSVNPTSAS